MEWGFLCFCKRNGLEKGGLLLEVDFVHKWIYKAGGEGGLCQVGFLWRNTPPATPPRSLSSLPHTITQTKAQILKRPPLPPPIGFFMPPLLSHPKKNSQIFMPSCFMPLLFMSTLNFEKFKSSVLMSPLIFVSKKIRNSRRYIDNFSAFFS